MGKQLFYTSRGCFLLIAVLGCIAYSNTFSVPFHWDDRFVIIENPIIKDLRFFIEPSKAEVFQGHFEYSTFRNRYIGYLTFALNYALHGLNVTGYHIVNLFIHIVNALLVWLLVMLTLKTPFLLESRLRNHATQIAVFTALLFVCHPVQTEAVTYIWQRVASLATLFYLLSLVTYIQWRLSTLQLPASRTLDLFTAKNSHLYLGSFLSAVLAMKTKETAFTLPLTVSLYEFIFFRGGRRMRLLCLFPLLLTMLIIPATLLDFDKPFGALISDTGNELRGNTTMTRWDYLFAEFRVIVTYIRLIFFPVNQNIDYDYPAYSSFFDTGVLLSFLLLASIAGTGIFVWKQFRYSAAHSRIIPFGIAWFFICIALESSIIPLNNVIFEHRVYLPSVGVFFALVTVLYMFAEKRGSGGMNRRIVAAGILTVIIALLTGATHARNAVWKDEVTLWKDTVQKSPEKKRPRDSLGLAYNVQGLYEKAIPQFRTSLRIDPSDPDTHYNLGVALQSAGNMSEAIQEYRISIRLNPHPDAYYNLGHAYHSLGLIEKAIEHYTKALRLKPDYQEAHYNLGIAYRTQGRIDKANKNFEAARRLRSASREE